MADQWLHVYHQNTLSNDQHLPFHLSDSTVVTTAVSSATTPPASSGLSPPDGARVVKPVRKRSRASRRTPTTLLNTDAANFRAMVQQFTGGPNSNANNVIPNFATFGFPGNNSSHTVFHPTAYHLPDPPPLFQFQNQPPPPQQQPPFMFSLSNSAASEEAFFQQAHGGGPRSNHGNVN